jgi:hypothetical protein
VFKKRNQPKASEPQTAEPKMHGILAKFETQEALVEAAQRVYEAGYRQFDAYSPYPIEELSHVMHMKPSPLPWVILAGGVLGAVSGFLMQAFATVVDYPLNIGGRPPLSWPAYIPITFEMTILLAGFAGVFGLFFFTRLPQPYHPVFNSEDFNQHASQDAFYLGIEAGDSQFDAARTRRLLEDLGSVQVSEIEE